MGQCGNLVLTQASLLFKVNVRYLIKQKRFGEIDGLHVTSWRPCWWTGTIRFFSSEVNNQHGGNANHL